MTKKSDDIFLQNLANGVIVIVGIGWLLHIGSSIVVPFIFSILFAVFLYPIEKKFRKAIKWKGLSILLSFMCIVIPILLLTTLFSFQLMSIIDSFPAINSSMQSGLDKIMNQVNQMLPFLNISSESLLNDEAQKDIQGPLKFIGQGLLSTTEFLAALGMSTFYTFFLLYYRESFKNFIVFQFEKSARPDIKETLSAIKETIQSYIGGLGIVVVILSIMNSIGLTLIGIDYAIFWGVLAGILAIIPFVGTLLGGLLPFIYAIATADAQWQPIAVVVYYLFIQQLEGNFITPKIVGDKVDINPLFAILSLVFFGTFWGIAGVILALPIISIIKIILSNFENTLPYAVLMSSDISKKKGIFKRIANR